MVPAPGFNVGTMVVGRSSLFVAMRECRLPTDQRRDLHEQYEVRLFLLPHDRNEIIKAGRLKAARCVFARATG